MREPTIRLFAALTLAFGWALSAGANAATDATAKDEARWRTEDATPQARYQTLKKEAQAAYRENTNQCKSMPSSERATCVKDAKANLQKDLADAKKASAK